MSVVHIRSETTQHTLRVSIDGAWYRVVHTVYSGESRGYGSDTPSSDYWRVFGSRGSYAERECDQDKPTFKRVVAAVKEALAQRETSNEKVPA